MGVADSPYFKYDIPAFSFLERARKQLDLFEAGAPESLFYATLELRMGIEARLFEYIEASTDNKKPLKHSKEYVASKLLKILAEVNPNYDMAAQLAIGLDNSTSTGHFEYTPVTRKLAAYHGRLGEILHYKFFR